MVTHIIINHETFTLFLNENTVFIFRIEIILGSILSSCHFIITKGLQDKRVHFFKQAFSNELPLAPFFEMVSLYDVEGNLDIT